MVKTYTEFEEVIKYSKSISLKSLTKEKVNCTVLNNISKTYIESQEHALKTGAYILAILREELNVPPEDVYKVVEFGAAKYEAEGWLQPNGVSTCVKDMCKCMFSHYAYMHICGIAAKDDESGILHGLHFACRCCMLYTRYKRGIKNAADS